MSENKVKEKFKAALERKAAKTGPAGEKNAGSGKQKGPQSAPSARKMFRRKSGS
jgi:hypothetical protein